MSTPRRPLLFSALVTVLGLAGILTIGWLYPGRPRTLLTNLGPTVLLLVSAGGLVSLLAHAVAAFARSRRQ